jgi:hypothetical protein
MKGETMEKKKLIIHRRDGTNVEVEPIKLWSPIIPFCKKCEFYRERPDNFRGMEIAWRTCKKLKRGISASEVEDKGSPDWCPLKGETPIRGKEIMG